MGTIKDSLTFDDVTLVPQYSSVLPSETNTVFIKQHEQRNTADEILSIVIHLILIKARPENKR